MARTVAEIQKLFLSLSRYAVVGASKDQSKYGTKVRNMILGPTLTKAACSFVPTLAGFEVVFSTQPTGHPRPSC